MAKTENLSWQCEKRGFKKRLEHVFNTGCFSDIRINCHGDIKFDLHRMVLAMCSPVFESMLFGPLSKSADGLCLDDDSEALRYVFAHCYGVDLQCDSIELALDIYKIADKYILTELKEKLTVIICNLIKPENFKDIYDFVIEYDFHDLKESCVCHLQKNCDKTKATEVLKWFSKNSPKHLLMPIIGIDDITFETWRNPTGIEFSEDVITMLQSIPLHTFAGQISGDVLKYIPGPLYCEFPFLTEEYYPVLRLSLTISNAKDIIMALHERYKIFGSEDIGIHIPNEYIPFLSREHLNLPCYNCTSWDKYPPERVTLYFSDLTKENFMSLSSLLYSLAPVCYNCDTIFHSVMFPCCQIKSEDYTNFCETIFGAMEQRNPYKYIRISSTHIDTKDEKCLWETLRPMFGIDLPERFPYIKLHSSESDIPGW